MIIINKIKNVLKFFFFQCANVFITVTNHGKSANDLITVIKNELYEKA